MHPLSFNVLVVVALIVVPRPGYHPPDRPGYAPVFRDVDLSFVLADPEDTDESAERQADQDYDSDDAY